MIVSFQHRFIYLAVPKTASTALYTALEPFGARIVPYRPAPHPGYERDFTGFHESAVPPELQGYFTFATVRNPFARAVSAYVYAKTYPTHRLYGLAIALTFDEFLLVTMRKRLATQCEFIADTRLDAIIRCEDDIGSQLSAMPFSGGQLIAVDRLNASRYHRPWKEYYTPESVAMVREWAAEDFVRFGYATTLEEPCTLPSSLPATDAPDCSIGTCAP